MRRIVHKRGLLLIFLICFFSIASFSQTVKGIWRGYFIGNSGEQYRLEFQIGQNSDGAISVKGVSYSWQDDIRFYGKATMTGSYVNSSQNFRIQEIKTVEVKNPSGGGTCIMKYDLHYTRSGKEEFLEGTYLGKQEVRSGVNPYQWGDCGAGRVYLRRVTTTDFILEPYLRDKNSNTTTIRPPVNSPPGKTETTPPVKTPPANSTVKKPTTRPVTTPPKTTPKNTPPKTNTNTARKPVTSDKPVATAPRKNLEPSTGVRDTINDATIGVIREKTPKTITSAPIVIRNRQSELMKALVVTDPDVTVKLYDNGEIDGDTISVYLDNKLVLSNKLLTASPLTIKLKMDEENPDHELVMVAENLGRIPPNTSLMVVEAGDKRFEVRITSTEQKNALVRFKYQKP